MNESTDLPLVLQWNAFSRRDAEREGVSPARLRRKDLRSPFRSVRVVRSLASAGAAAELLPILPRGHVFSHLTAARLWRMWLPDRLDESQVDVLAIGAARPMRMRGVRGHHAAAIPIALADGMPVVAAADAWVALGELLTIDELIAAGCSLVRRQDPCCRLEDLVAAIERNSGRRGLRLVRRAMRQVRAGSDSVKEVEVRLILVRHGLPEPAVNAVVSPPGAKTVRYGDLVYPQWRVIVEYDGGQHWATAKKRAQHVLRLEELRRYGWTVISVVSVHLDDPVGLTARVVEALREGGWRPPTPSKSQL